MGHRLTTRWVGRIVGGLALAAAIVAVIRSRRTPSACPYQARFMLALPRPYTTRTQLRQSLAPQSGERLLELGPGTGYYTLDAAEWVSPEGTLDVIDIQAKMLTHTEQRATKRGITNLAFQQGDAQHLPYENASFDAAYLVTVLGEIPDQEAALRELFRVVKPGGHFVVGEALPDPDMIPFGSLCDRVVSVGFEFDRRLGWIGGYFARFNRPSEV